MLSLLAAAVVQVTPRDFQEAREPQLAITADHSVYVAFGMANGVYVSHSGDEGGSFDSPVKIDGLEKLALGMRRGPRITAHGKVVAVTAISHATGNLMAYVSGDRGKHWSSPAKVNDAEGSAREGLHAMAAAADGTIACAWLDARTPGTKIYMATSTDGGANWSRNHLAYASPGGTVCECCHPSINFDRKGRVYVMFRNCLDGARDMHFVSSADRGVTWTPAKKLGTGSWKLNACPMDGGAFCFDEKNQLQTVWRREGQVFTVGESGAERLVGEGSQAWMTWGKGGPYTVWARGGGILATTRFQREVELTRRGNDAVAAASPQGDLIIAAWTEGGVRALRLNPR